MPDYTTSVEIRATPEQVFDFLVTPDGMTAWMGQHAVLDPVEDGIFAVDIAGAPIRGTYLEVTRPERVVVSWGVAGSDDLPPGSTTVIFTLTAIEAGTLVQLEHRGLPDDRVPGHADGWSHFLPRLADVSAGRVPADDSDWLPLPVRGLS